MLLFDSSCEAHANDIDSGEVVLNMILFVHHLGGENAWRQF